METPDPSPLLNYAPPEPRRFRIGRFLRWGFLLTLAHLLLCLVWVYLAFNIDPPEIVHMIAIWILLPLSCLAHFLDLSDSIPSALRWVIAFSNCFLWGFGVGALITFRAMRKAQQAEARAS